MDVPLAVRISAVYEKVIVPFAKIHMFFLDLKGLPLCVHPRKPGVFCLYTPVQKLVHLLFCELFFICIFYFFFRYIFIFHSRMPHKSYNSCLYMHA